MITKNSPLHNEGMAIKAFAELLKCKKIKSTWVCKINVIFFVLNPLCKNYKYDLQEIYMLLDNLNYLL